MYKYEIPMRFKYKAVHDYEEFVEEFEKASEIFNKRAEQVNKCRKIVNIEYEKDGFIVIMESTERLVSPSKALSVFSQELAKMKKVEPYLSAKRNLLANNGTPSEQKIETEIELTLDDTLKTVVDILMGGGAEDSAFVKSGRKDAANSIITICKEFRERS